MGRQAYGVSLGPRISSFSLTYPPISFSFRVLPLYLTKCCFCHRLLLSACQCDGGGQVLQPGRKVVHSEFVWTRKGAQEEGTQRGGADGGPSLLLRDFPVNVGNEMQRLCGVILPSVTHLRTDIPDKHIGAHMSSQPLLLNQTPPWQMAPMQLSYPHCF